MAYDTRILNYAQNKSQACYLYDSLSSLPTLNSPLSILRW